MTRVGLEGCLLHQDFVVTLRMLADGADLGRFLNRIKEFASDTQTKFSSAMESGREMMKEKKASVSAALDAGKLAMAAAAITNHLKKIQN